MLLDACVLDAIKWQEALECRPFNGLGFDPRVLMI